MNDNIQETLNKLENYKETHPNLYVLWREYIKKKVDNLNYTISSCNNIINLINDTGVNDLNINTILTLILIMNIDDLNE